jgi:hypothetical protein
MIKATDKKAALEFATQNIPDPIIATLAISIKVLISSSFDENILPCIHLCFKDYESLETRLSTGYNSASKKRSGAIPERFSLAYDRQYCSRRRARRSQHCITGCSLRGKPFC